MSSLYVATMYAYSSDVQYEIQVFYILPIMIIVYQIARYHDLIIIMVHTYVTHHLCEW